MARLRDDLLVYNERTKLLATTLNAVGLGLIGFSLLRPLTQDPATVSWLALWWSGVGVAFHLAALYILGRMHKEVPDDSL